jgi:hypothetical protein
MKLDGWTLRNGVTTNKKHPKTFHIPTEKERTNLVSSDLAKLLPEHVIDIVPAKKPAARKRKHAKKPAARKPSR